MESFKKSDFVANGISANFVQDNYSYSVKGVLRGLHYQLRPKAQAKLVWVVKGEIFDVVVDIRKGSPTYGKWVGEKLSEVNQMMLYLPLGFAHGFCVLSSEAEVLYKASEEYAPEYNRGIIWNDPAMGITWPTDKPLPSKTDAALPKLSEVDNNFVYQSIS